MISQLWAQKEDLFQGKSLMHQFLQLTLTSSNGAIQIRAWVRLIRRLAKGGDNKAKSLSNAIGEAMYQAVDTSSKHTLDLPTNNGMLNLDCDEDIDNQDKVIKIILNILAADFLRTELKD